MHMTHMQYLEHLAERTRDVKSLVRRALDGMLPEGNFLTDDRNVIHGNALLAIMPTERLPGSKAMHLCHTLNHRPTENQIIPSTESLSIHGGVFGETWATDVGFGKHGQITVEVIGGDLVCAVRELVSQMMTQPMFAAFEWRKSDHDPLKHELFLGARKVQSVWKSGTRWGTLVGNSHDSLRLAKKEAVAAAQASLKSFHDERLAGLDRLAA